MRKIDLLDIVDLVCGILEKFVIKCEKEKVDCFEIVTALRLLRNSKDGEIK